MSYRNPTIVNDTSGSVLGQAIAQGAQNLAQGIIGHEKANQVAKEKERIQLEKDKKDNIDRNNATIAYADQANKDAQKQAANIEKYAINVEESAKKYYEELALEKDGYANIHRENPTAENTQKMVEVMGRVNDYNTLIVNTGAMQQRALEHQKLGTATLNGKVLYPSINGDDGESAILINNGLSAANGYGYRLDPGAKDDKKMDRLVILSPLKDWDEDPNTPDTRKETSFSHQEIKNMGPLWSLKDKNMVTSVQENSKSAMIVVQQGGKEITNRTMLATEDVPGAKEVNGEIPQQPIMQNKPTGRIEGGYYVNESQLSTDLFTDQVKARQADAVANIDSYQTAHDRKSYLLDLNISPTNYEKMTPTKKIEAINNSIKNIMLDTYNVKEKDGEYFRETRGEKVETTTVSAEKITAKEIYDKYSTGVNEVLNIASDMPGAAPIARAKSIITDFAALGSGATISSGSTKDYRSLSIDINDNFVVTVTKGDGQSRFDGATAYDLTLESGAENFLRNKTNGNISEKQLDKMAKELSKKLKSLKPQQ